MRKLLLALLLLAAGPAWAQQQADPAAQAQSQALSQTVLDLTGQGVQLRAQIFAAQAEIKRLTDENTALKSKADK